MEASGLLLHPDTVRGTEGTVVARNATVVPEERFVHMTVTRNAGATIPAERPSILTRPVLEAVDAPKPLPRARTLSRGLTETADIEGAAPRRLHPVDMRRAPPEPIEGSSPRAVGFRTRRTLDPLEPRYSLPKAEERPPTPPPFKRDLMSTTVDIKGAAPCAHLPWAPRDTLLKVDDIAGTRSRPRTRTSEHHISPLATEDINTMNGSANPMFRSRRTVDPLRPTYALHGRVVVDDDPGAFSAPSVGAVGGHAARLRTMALRQGATAAEAAAVTLHAPPTRPDFSLTTEDIPGAVANPYPEPIVGGILPSHRRDYRNTNFIGDLPGAHASTFKRGLAVPRGTDPNQPDYVFLDGRTASAEERVLGKSWYSAATTLLAAEAAEESATLPLGRTGLATGVAPAVSYAKRLVDPRDAELARLRGQAETLARERETLVLAGEVAAGTKSEAVAAGARPRVPLTSVVAYRGLAPPGLADTAHGSPHSGAGGESAGTASALTMSLAQSRERASGYLLPAPPRSATTAARAEAYSHGAELDAAYGAGGEGGGADGRAAGGRHLASAPAGDGSIGGGGALGGSLRTAMDSLPRSAGGAAGGGGGLGGTTASLGASAARADPVGTLRARGARTSTRNILGILPATRPPQDLVSTASLRASSGRYDKGLEASQAVPRHPMELSGSAARGTAGARLTAKAGATSMGGTYGKPFGASQGLGGFSATQCTAGGPSFEARVAASSHATEIASVRALPF